MLKISEEEQEVGVEAYPDATQRNEMIVPMTTVCSINM